MYTELYKAEQEMRKRQQDHDDHRNRMQHARLEAGLPISFPGLTMADCIAGVTMSNTTMTILKEPDKKLLLLRRRK